MDDSTDSVPKSAMHKPEMSPHIQQPTQLKIKGTQPQESDRTRPPHSEQLSLFPMRDSGSMSRLKNQP